MTAQILFAAKPESWGLYEAPLKRALSAEGIQAAVSCDIPAESVDYIIYAPNSTVQDFSVFPKLKAVFSLWAGVETIVKNTTLTVPLARMVDEGLTDGMVEWVTGHVLRYHLGMDAHINNPDRRWNAIAPPLARQRVVTVLGLGALGQACAAMIKSLGFETRGWSRSPKSLPQIACFSGEGGLLQALNGTDILVLLLPQTPQTEDIVNAQTLACLRKGAFVINPGRGPLIDDAALIAALDSGHVEHATLDVFRTEPLPQEHRFWSHPKVTVTPHIASETRVETASESIARNIKRAEDGKDLLHLVDRSTGY